VGLEQVEEFSESPEVSRRRSAWCLKDFRFLLPQKLKNQASGKTRMLYGAGKLSKKIVVQLRALSTIAAPVTPAFDIALYWRRAPRTASEGAKSTSAGPHAAFFQHSSLRCRKPLNINVLEPDTP